MKLVVLLLVAVVFTSEKYMIDFGNSSQGEDWFIVNDDVMGGRSNSKATVKNDYLLFEGNVSLENNGGFASVRAPYRSLDLSKFEKVTLRVKGTNRKFALNLDNHRAWYKPNYKFEFIPKGDDWQEFSIPLTDFKQTRIGEFTGKNMTRQNLERVIQMGIILYDKQAGPFELKIDYIKFE